MKIAVTFENGNVFQHFGHTEKFKIYDISNGKIVNESIVDTNGSGHGALAGFLKENSVDTLICGGIGNGAKQALAEAGIVYDDIGCYETWTDLRRAEELNRVIQEVDYVTVASSSAAQALAAMLDLGSGSGPMNHGFAIKEEW